MNHKPRPGGLIYGAASAILCMGITIGGVQCVANEAQEPAFPVPTEPAPVLAIPVEEPAIAAADLWSDDRSRNDAPLLDVELDAETQWAIFGQCGQDKKLFCAAMAIAATESGFDLQTVGDGGDSIGMMQINARWHADRIKDLGVTDLTDPVQCAAVAVDYLLELESIMGAGPDDHALYMSYNSGPASAVRKIRAGITATEYSTAVMAAYQNYITEMEG